METYLKGQPQYQYKQTMEVAVADALRVSGRGAGFIARVES